ncbi:MULTISPECIES: type II toxin-antitoxin system RelB/DinJ family antitoxin [Legionella]|uniref:Antitoxin DinJ n=2 Tax=Legionella TaxID=445 RepID=A0A0W1AMF3_9GAMM|nr:MULTISPECIES: type II toxin-antitoxin system RelB/DinJ family antitoxin [Legionella]KTD82450.1 Antitoxin DinJ [Legionella waltersii]RJT43707.1 type II toxin-antitoxin system RelB/DinJ family antitoxin [Legionella taurinensis]SNU95837.1 RelB antitoxin [Legionella waltersii]HAT4482010.1 type II toxin-antitoxin system RelB/DinJ family antitoxin [Legionella pneumophila]HAU0031606.1 type II toxin-antitoxin system RelB/DinJ family antitoxin [Legionella pneumophila]
MKTATVRARVEPELKLEVESVLNELGLSVSEAIELYLHQIKLIHGIPFDIRLPNKVTQQTFKKTDEGSELNYYDNSDDLFKKLGN